MEFFRRQIDCTGETALSAEHRGQDQAGVSLRLVRVLQRPRGSPSGVTFLVIAADFRADPVVLEGLWPEASASFIWAFGRHVSKAEQSEHVTPKEITDSICCQ